MNFENPNESANSSAYWREYLAAFDRTHAFGLEPPIRMFVTKDCVNLDRVVPVLLDYFETETPDRWIGQTAAIHFALIPLLYRKTGIPFNLTVGWVERQGKRIFEHDEALIREFIERGTSAWLERGCPFHLWLTSPAFELVDVTFAMNLGWAKTRADCERLIVYRSWHSPADDPVYHPTIVGPDFFHKTGAVL